MQYNLLFYFKIFQWQYNEAMQFVLRVAPKIYLLAQRAYLIFKYMRQKCYIKKSLISQIELFSIAVQYYFTKPKTVCFANNSISYDHYSNHICTTHVIILFYTIISSVYVRIQKIILWVQDSMQQYSSSSIKGNGKLIFFFNVKRNLHGSAPYSVVEFNLSSSKYWTISTKDPQGLYREISPQELDLDRVKGEPFLLAIFLL